MGEIATDERMIRKQGLCNSIELTINNYYGNVENVKQDDFEDVINVLFEIFIFKLMDFNLNNNENLPEKMTTRISYKGVLSVLLKLLDEHHDHIYEQVIFHNESSEKDDNRVY